MAEERQAAVNPVLEVSDLEVVYRTDEETVYAVNGLSLKVNAGETLGWSERQALARPRLR